MAVAVVVPWRGGCPWRERALGWVRERYRLNHPDWPVIIGEHNSGPWVKARALEAGLARTNADVIVIADGDVWSDGLQDAVDLLSVAPWVVPHLTVHRLTPASSEAVYAGAQPADVHDYDQAPYHGWAGGGLVVIRQDDYWRAPFDPRFEKWGLEDASFAIAADELVGPHQRLNWPLWHLWHPPQARMNRRIGNPQSEALWRRYRRSRGRRDRMEALVAEGRAHGCVQGGTDRRAQQGGPPASLRPGGNR